MQVQKTDRSPRSVVHYMLDLYHILPKLEQSVQEDKCMICFEIPSNFLKCINFVEICNLRVSENTAVSFSGFN